VHTTSQLEQFSQEVMKDPTVQKRLLEAATDSYVFSELVVKLGNEKGFNFTNDEVLATLDLSGYYHVEHLNPNHENPSFFSGRCERSTF
jgi:hypothetical protein